MKLLGIDPSMSGTGIVAIDVSGAAGLTRVELLHRWTIRPKGDSLYARATHLTERISSDLSALSDSQDPNDWTLVVEDPTDYQGFSGNKTAGETLARFRSGAVLGVAVGAVLGNLECCCRSFFNRSRVVVLPSRVWLPRGLRQAFLKHADVVRTLRRWHKPLVECNDDEVMAAGVALYWYRNQRTAEAQAAAYYRPTPRLPRRPAPVA